MLSAPVTNLVNALVLIAMSAWGYLDAERSSVTILIPMIAGVVLLLCQPGVKSENKVVSHIAVLVTALILLALFMPLSGAISRGDPMAIGRVATMTLTSLVALIAFVRSFITARKAAVE